MTSIQHELKNAAPRARIVEALSRGLHLERWHGAKVTDSGGVLRLEYPSGVTFRWQIVESNPDRVTWKCVEGPGNSVDTEATFELKDAGSGRTGVLFEHSGWTDSDPSFRKCNTLWGQLLHQLQQHLTPTKTHTAEL